MARILAWAAASAWLAATAADKADSDKEPTLKETMAAVGRIATELRQVDASLNSVEKSVASINATLGSVDRSLSSIDRTLGAVGAAIKPEGINVIVTRASDVAYERAKTLILLVTACAAGLIALHALLRRGLPARKPG